VYGVGHSFGGAILCCAAAHRPQLFEKLVIVDPPMFSPATRGVAYLASALGLESWHPLVSRALRRRNKWVSHDDARAYLETRGVFKDMHPQVLSVLLSFLAFLVQKNNYGHLRSCFPSASTLSCSMPLSLVLPRRQARSLVLVLQARLY